MTWNKKGEVLKGFRSDERLKQ